MISDKQRDALTAALRDAGRYRLALGGSAALAAYGLPGFSAKYADLVTPLDKFKRTDKAASAVEKQLRRAGYAPELIGAGHELRRFLPPGPGTLAQWRVPTVTSHDHPPLPWIDGGTTTRYWCRQCNDKVILEMSHAPRSREPVRTPLGPVLHIEDAAGSLVLDLADRAHVRDYVRTAKLLDHWSPGQLTGFAQRLDPTLDRRDLEAAAAHLATLPDIALTAMGAVRDDQVPRLREKFANWQRDPRDLARPEPARQAERPAIDRQARYRPADKALALIRRQREAELGGPERSR